MRRFIQLSLLSWNLLTLRLMAQSLRDQTVMVLLSNESQVSFAGNLAFLHNSPGKRTIYYIKQLTNKPLFSTLPRPFRTLA